MLHKVRPMYEVSSVAVEVVGRMIDREDRMLESVRRLKTGMRFFVSSMNDLGLRTLETHGNFVYVAFGRYGQPVHDRLKSLVLYRRDAGFPCLGGLSRFSATTVECFVPVIEAIREVVGAPADRNRP